MLKKQNKKTPGDIIILDMLKKNQPSVTLQKLKNQKKIWVFFALLPPIDPENKNFEKMKKVSEDIIL